MSEESSNGGKFELNGAGAKSGGTQELYTQKLFELAESVRKNVMEIKIKAMICLKLKLSIVTTTFAWQPFYDEF